MLPVEAAHRKNSQLLQVDPYDANHLMKQKMNNMLNGLLMEMRRW